MTILLITGSRRATPEMLDYARRAVLRVKELNWEIVVGDANGIDYAVICACHQEQVRFTIYGVAPNPRNYCCLHHMFRSYEQIGVEQQSIRDRYLARDRYMVGMADRCLAIVRNRSSGTMYTYSHAVRKGIPADLKEFA